MTRTVPIPNLHRISGKVSGNPVEQVEVAGRDEKLTGRSVVWARGGGELVEIAGVGDVLISPKPTAASDYDRVVVWPELADPARTDGARWTRPRPEAPGASTHVAVRGARGSWTGQFSMTREREVDGQERSGLRPPQVGAIHAALAHWTVTSDLGTVVMPTGTGKTETMVALLVSERLERLLVIAPTSALRAQIAGKFATLGLLKQIGEADDGGPAPVVGPGALYPVVGRLERRLDTPAEAAAFARGCNVVVATVQAITQCTPEVQEAFAGEFSHLFIDEAHHAPARTWNWFRSHFLTEGKPVLQFTATPYRRDGKHVGGRIIYNYPLKKAQEEGYFRPITFRSIWEYNTERADEEIARVAIEQLDEDRGAGYDHIIMARTDSKEHAERLADVYRRLAPHLNAVCVHSDVPAADQRDRLADLFAGRSRVVCCVNMLGEGFDLPRLKIAALHEVHKSLAITIQFTGRFTRKGAGVGDATVVANLADAKVEEALEDLYSEDPDWNQILVEKSTGETEKQRERTAFVESFGPDPFELPIQNFQPKMSAVAYRTTCSKWRPGKLKKYLEGLDLPLPPKISKEHRTAVFVVREEVPADWANAREVQDVTHDLYLLHWSEAQGVLYINSTNNGSLHRRLAEAVAGEDVDLLHGEDVYRALAGVRRAVLSNVGLKHSFSKAVQFSMHVGTDIANALSDAQTRKRTKTNLFARGFEDGEPTTVGCSHKGRVWSYRIAESMAEWVEWATATGAKLIDDTVVVEDLLEKVIKPVRITERPPGRVPLAVEWSEYFWDRGEGSVWVEVGGQEVPFFEAEMVVTRFDGASPIRFAVVTAAGRAEYEVRLSKTGAAYVPLGAEAALRASGRKRPLSEWFQEEAPVVRFDSNAFLVGDLWYEPSDEDRAPYDPDKIEAWDWAGVDVKKESKRKTDAATRTVAVVPDSVQAHVVDRLQSAAWPHDYDVVFDDDDSGEAADVVALKVAAGDRLVVHLFHLKYSSGEGQKAGARVGDLYEVCGQAQRSVVWKHPLQRLFDHLRHRESKRQTDYGGESRFERGTAADLARIERKARVLELDFRVYIVQPGLSKSKVTGSQLDLLGATETYLLDTYAVPLRVIASP